MCPLYPFHVIILYLCLLLPLLFAIIEGADELAGIKVGKWNLTFQDKFSRPYEKITNLTEYDSAEVELTCQGCPALPDTDDPGNLQLVLTNDKSHIASINNQNEDIVLNVTELDFETGFKFNITGKFLGYTTVKAELKTVNDDVLAEKKLDVAIVRKKTIQSKVFAYSVAILVSLAYINMGCAMDMEVVKKTIKKPIGPAIGFACQYVVMPLIAYGLGFIFGIGTEEGSLTALRLGLFVTGISPGGGASNIWTVMFGGNLDLSVTMTAVSTFSAFVMMPFWIFTLGSTIFNDGNIVIPYKKICTYAGFLIVPLCIGLAIARWLPKVSNFLVRILKPMALFLILFIIIFGVWANLYIFKMMTWQVCLTGMGLPWMGFSFGFILAKLLRRPAEDVIAIAIETGIQNTGISIFILWGTLPQPLADMTAVIPVAAATMTPLPLLAALIVMKIKECSITQRKHDKIPIDEQPSIIKAKPAMHRDQEVKDSESTLQLVNCASDANDNSIA